MKNNSEIRLATLDSDIETEMQVCAAELGEKFPFFNDYEFNEYGAPTLDGGSIFDMGLFLLILDEAGAPSNSVALANLLSVVKLTIRNWLKKCQCDVRAEIELVGFGKSSHYVLRSWGVYSENKYEPFRPYVRLMIARWRMTENEKPRTEPGVRSGPRT